MTCFIAIMMIELIFLLFGIIVDSINIQLPCRLGSVIDEAIFLTTAPSIGPQTPTAKAGNNIIIGYINYIQCIVTKSRVHVTCSLRRVWLDFYGFDYPFSLSNTLNRLCVHIKKISTIND